MVITIPSTYYLLQPQLKPKKSHGHDHHDEEHGEHEEHEESEESEPSHDEDAKSDDHEEGEDSDSGILTDAADADSGDGGGEDKAPPGTSGLGSEEGRRKKSNQAGIRQGYAETKEQDPKDKDLVSEIPRHFLHQILILYRPLQLSLLVMSVNPIHNPPNKKAFQTQTRSTQPTPKRLARARRAKACQKLQSQKEPWIHSDLRNEM